MGAFPAARNIPDFEFADALIRIDKAFGWGLEDHFDDEENPWPISRETHRSYKKAHRRASAETIAALRAAYQTKGGLIERPPARAGVWPQEEKWTALRDFDTLSHRTEVRLSEQLRRVHNVARARLLLRKLRRSRADMLLIDAALANISEVDVLARLGNILVELLGEFWDSDFAGVQVAPVALERLVHFAHSDGNTKVRRLIEKLEGSLGGCDPHRVAVFEPLCMCAMRLKQDGAFVAHVTRLLESPSWQKEDSKTRKYYYRTWDGTVDNVIRHVSDRAIELRCHDAGTVIELAMNRCLNEDQKQWLAGEMEESLRTIGIGARLVGKFHDRVFLAPGGLLKRTSPDRDSKTD